MSTNNKRKLFPDNQNEIKFDNKLIAFFDESKNGSIRMIKVIINENKTLELNSCKMVKNETAESTWMSHYDEIVLESVDQHNPCFLFYRLDEKNVLDNEFKWIFIAWSPCSVSNKHRTIYALTKSSLLQKFTGGHIKRKIFATDLQELSLETYLAYQAMPAPLNEFEKKMIELEESEQQARAEKSDQEIVINLEKFRLLPTLPIDSLALTQLDLFKQEKNAYLRFYIDLSSEKIFIEKVINCFNVNLIQNEIPLDKSRFHLFRFNHHLNSKSFKSNIFIYSIPDALKNVKERMIYSSCKNELLNHFKVNTGLQIAKAFEVTEPSELSKDFLIESIHNIKLNKQVTSAAVVAVQPLATQMVLNETEKRINEEEIKNMIENENAISMQTDSSLIDKIMSTQIIYLIAFGFLILSLLVTAFKAINNTR